MFTLLLFAQRPPAGNPFDRPEILWATAGLAGALIVGAIVVLVVDRWRKRGLAPVGKSADELTEYRGLYESGEITEAEYAKLRQQVADRVKQSVLPAAPLVEGASPAPSPLVNGLPRVPPVVPPATSPEPKPWEQPRRESDPPA